MGFMIQPEVCPCCRDALWHCEKCWNIYHHGLRDKDYIPPKYYGQPLLPEGILKESGFISGVKADKNHHYREGVYEH